MGNIATRLARLELLEARAPKVDAEQMAQLEAAIKALFDAVSMRREWAPAKVAPFYWEEQPSDMGRLWERIKAGEVTADDRAILDGLPKCHITPEQLVEAAAKVGNEV